MICTPCGEEIGEGRSAIFGIERDGVWSFGWTCCHRPVGDVAVVLASSDCCVKWLREHPECIEKMGKLFTDHEHR